MTIPPRIHETGRRVDEQTDATKRTFAFQPRYNRVAETDPFKGISQNKLAGMKNKRLVVLNQNHLVQIRYGLAEVDVRCGRVAKN